MAVGMRKLHPYLDYGKPGTLRYQGGKLVEGRKVPAVPLRRLPASVLRQKGLDPELIQTDRTLCRWSENAGSGMPNLEAEMRETHYDPLPPVIHVQVTEIVDTSPWHVFIRKIYLTSLERGQLYEQLGISRTQFYCERSAALWYFRGRFETSGIYG